MIYFFYLQACRIAENPFRYFSKKTTTGLTSSVISKNNNKNIADKTVSKLRSIMTVLPFTDKEIGESLNSNFKDFEDGIQYFISINNGLDTIITKNISDYKNVDIHIFMPNDFLNLEKNKTIIELK